MKQKSEKEACKQALQLAGYHKRREFEAQAASDANRKKIEALAPCPFTADLIDSLPAALAG